MDDSILLIFNSSLAVEPVDLSSVGINVLLKLLEVVVEKLSVVFESLLFHPTLQFGVEIPTIVVDLISSEVEELSWEQVLDFLED